MAEAVVSVALETVRDLLVEEGKFLLRVKDEVNELKAEFTRMQCFLRDADRRKHENELIRNHLAEIRSLAYRTQDVLEEYALKVESKSNGGCSILTQCIPIHNIGSEVLRIKSQLDSIGKSLQHYGIKEDDVQVYGGGLETRPSGGVEDDDLERALRQTYGHEVEENFVGMEEDIRKVMDYILNTDESRVVSICGMGGLGKTTLARKVFNQDDIRRGFESFAWVCISKQCQKRVVLGEILRQLLPKDQPDRVKGMEENELVEEIHNTFKTKKCLLVVDDIWELDHWELLKSAFPVGRRGTSSKFLLTSRNAKFGSVGILHIPSVLKEDDAWQLLKSKAFACQESLPEVGIQSELEFIGREIVRKCGYLPLAISVIGGVLSKFRASLSEWEKVKEDIIRGDGTEVEKNMQNILDLSYRDLPHYLKPCFLYLGSAFGEDQEIPVDDLYIQWIAEGMVSADHQGQRETMMDVAERYLTELASRCLVEVSTDELQPYRRYTRCHLHDLLHELCLAKVIEENFRTKFINVQGDRRFVAVNSQHEQYDKTRRLVLRVDEDMGEEDKIEIVSYVHRIGRQLRSLAILGPLPSPISINFHYGLHLKLLKMLVLECVDLRWKLGRKRLRGLGKLTQLKFLSLRNSWIVELPSSISKLTRLQTLNLNVNISSVLKLNLLNTRRMTHLRQLYLPCLLTRQFKKLRLDGCDNLEILHGFNNSTCESSTLSQLKNLRQLDAIVERDNELLSMIIDEMRHLHRLELHTVDCDFSSEEGVALLKRMLTTCPRLHHLTIKGRISNFPCEDYYSRSIVSLKLEGCKLGEDPMEMLGRFPILRELGLDYAFVGKEMVCCRNGFPELRRLEILWLEDLESWRIEEGSMPNLSYLCFGRCTKLQMVPDGLKSVTTLKQLKITRMPAKFCRRLAKESGEDFDKICHVPSIEFAGIIPSQDSESDSD